MSEFLTKLSYLSPLILTLCVLWGAFYFTALNSKAKVIFFYLLCNLIVDIISRVIDYNLWLLTLLGIIDLLAFYLIFNFKALKKVYLSITVLGLIYIVSEFFFINFENYQSYVKVVSSAGILTMISFKILYYIRHDLIEKWEDLIFNSVVFTYFTLELIILLPVNFLISIASEYIHIIWIIRVLFMLAFYTYLLYYLWAHGRNQKLLHFG